MVNNDFDFFAAPLKWFSMPSDEIFENDLRLNTRSYDIEARHAKQQIQNNKYPLVTITGKSGLAYSYRGSRAKVVWVEKSKYPYFQPSSIMDLQPKPDGYISSARTNIKVLRVSRGQILMTCSGTIGNLTYVSRTLDNKIFSSDLFRICPHNQNDAGYIYTYLKSDIGKKILLSNNYGAVINHLDPEHLEKIPIPNPPEQLKKKIHELIVRSYELRDESNDLIDEATELLIDELKLPALEKLINQSCYQYSREVKNFTIKCEDLCDRLDAPYYLPVFNEIISYLKKHSEEVTTVGDSRISKNIILPGRFKRVYVEEGNGKIFIGGKQIGELDPSDKKYLSFSRHEQRIKQELEIHENMILLTCSGTIGKITLVPKHWNNWTVSQHIIRIVPISKDIAGYVYIFLQSEYGNALIKRCIYGAVVDEINDSHVSSIPFPLLKNHDVQNHINALALEVNQKRYEAYKLEQEALRIMNEEVIYVE